MSTEQPSTIELAYLVGKSVGRAEVRALVEAAIEDDDPVHAVNLALESLDSDD